LEGKDQNNGEVSKYLLETEVWKDLTKENKNENDTKVPTNDKGSAAGKAKGKVAAITPNKVAPKPRNAAPPSRLTPTKAASKGRCVPPANKVPPAKVAVGKAVKAPVQSSITPQANPRVDDVPVKLNLVIHESRIGLARILSQDTQKLEEVISLYEEVIKLAPHLHDSYIELGNLYVKNNPLAAVDIYCKYPFDGQLSYDDAFLYGEIVRILMKEEKFADTRLLPHMISLGKILRFTHLEKYVTILENKGCTSFLRELYAGINNKAIDDPEVVEFFRFKLWL